MKTAIRFCLAIVLALGGIVSLAPSESSAANEYFNSSEPGCDGSDPNVVWCDDFERGSWAYTYGNDGVPNPDNAGWNMTPYSPGCSGTGCLAGTNLLPDGERYARCGGVGAAGTNCAAWSGAMSGGGGSAPAMGDHNLGPNRNSYSELYMRHYRKFSSGFQFGQEKYWTINPCCAGIGGIKFAQHFTFPGGGSGQLILNVPAEDANRNQNITSINFTGGNWYYIEIHVKLNTPGVADGVWEMWSDNCGADGRGCTGPGTLRARHTNIMWRKAGDNSQMGSIWLENWSAPLQYGAQYPSAGEEYYDQIKVSRVRVGPAGASQSAGNPVPPAAPTSPAIR